jgi:hypothetical protein
MLASCQVLTLSRTGGAVLDHGTEFTPFLRASSIASRRAASARVLNDISVAQNLISSGVANLSVDTVALLFTLAVLWEMEWRLTTASASWDAGATGHGTPSGLRWTQRCAKSWVRARETGDQAPDVRARELRLTARPGTGSIGRLILHDHTGTPVRLILRVIVIHCGLIERQTEAAVRSGRARLRARPHTDPR